MGNLNDYNVQNYTNNSAQKHRLPNQQLPSVEDSLSSLPLSRSSQKFPLNIDAAQSLIWAIGAIVAPAIVYGIFSLLDIAEPIIVIGISLFTNIAAIICGSRGKKHIAQNPKQSGAGMALAGIIIGTIGSILNILGIIALFIV